jgi:hypothetical protein
MKIKIIKNKIVRNIIRDNDIQIEHFCTRSHIFIETQLKTH